jgi:hypothetical protein
MNNKQIPRAFRFWILLLAAYSMNACGGTYSNEDIEFQTSVPSGDDLRPNIAAQLVGGSAESYKLTYGVVQNYRQILGLVGSLLDHVRRYPATTRTLDSRIWGPFDADKEPGFQIRVSIFRLPPTVTLPSYQFAYSIDFGAKANKVFVPVIFGTFDPVGGVGEGNGVLNFDVDALRSIAFPVGSDVRELRSLNMKHSHQGDSRSLVVHQINVATAKSPTSDLTYNESVDGSANARFVMTLSENLWAQEVDVVSAWRGDGSGRGEIKVTSGLATGSVGTDCWGSSTIPTFVKRDWAPSASLGDVATCVLPPLR